MMNTLVPHDKWQSGGRLLIVAWMSSLGLSALLIFVEAKHPTLMDPMMPFLIGAVWLISVVALWIGTFRLTRSEGSRIIRIFVSVIAVIFQCAAYWLALTIGGAFDRPDNRAA